MNRNAKFLHLIRDGFVNKASVHCISKSSIPRTNTESCVTNSSVHGSGGEVGVGLRQADPWGLLASQSTQVDKHQTYERSDSEGLCPPHSRAHPCTLTNNTNTQEHILASQENNQAKASNIGLSNDSLAGTPKSPTTKAKTD